jgi:hypothetical protein
MIRRKAAEPRAMEAGEVAIEAAVVWSARVTVDREVWPVERLPVVGRMASLPLPPEGGVRPGPGVAVGEWPLPGLAVADGDVPGLAVAVDADDGLDVGFDVDVGVALGFGVDADVAVGFGVDVARPGCGELG